MMPLTARDPLSDNNQPEKESFLLFNCMSENAPEMYACTKCLFRAYLKVNLKIHDEIMHNRQEKVSVMNFCEISEQTYNLSDILKWHKCDRCDFSTFSFLFMAKHFYQHKPRAWIKKGKAKNPMLKIGLKLRRSDSFLSFNTIREKLTAKSHLESNLKSMAEDLIRAASLNCDQCSYTTDSKKNLLHHKSYVHEFPTAVQWYRCNKCSFRSTFQAVLQSHIKRSHSKGKNAEWFDCEQCLFKTSDADGLKQHEVATHTSLVGDKGWFRCAFCLFVATTRPGLETHVFYEHTRAKKDEGGEWFLCDRCAFKAKEEFLLIRHMRNHISN